VWGLAKSFLRNINGELFAPLQYITGCTLLAIPFHADDVWKKTTVQYKVTDSPRQLYGAVTDFRWQDVQVPVNKCPQPSSYASSQAWPAVSCQVRPLLLLKAHNHEILWHFLSKIWSQQQGFEKFELYFLFCPGIRSFSHFPSLVLYKRNRFLDEILVKIEGILKVQCLVQFAGILLAFRSSVFIEKLPTLFH